MKKLLSLSLISAVLCTALITLSACGQEEAPLQEGIFTKEAKLYYIGTGHYVHPPFLCCHIIETEDGELFTTDTRLEEYDQENFDKFIHAETGKIEHLNVRVTYRLSDKVLPKPRDPVNQAIFPCNTCYIATIDDTTNEIIGFRLPVAMIDILSLKEK